LNFNSNMFFFQTFYQLEKLYRQVFTNILKLPILIGFVGPLFSSQNLS
jgi:hypothetical protein